MRKIHRYYVKTIHDDFGNTDAELLTGRQARNLGYYNDYYQTTDEHDIYVDGFDSKHEAKAFKYEILEGQEELI
ncbi:hypothetical protein [Metaclostridioides mangenotii]|uniref:hypothetical protein n=1 Tax=Metaclostridioides mangenotii TaxID=1540 RepID=UPI0026F1E754|nr:hypothetical protein [Clostridioides mangenotii]